MLLNGSKEPGDSSCPFKEQELKDILSVAQEGKPPTPRDEYLHVRVWQVAWKRSAVLSPPDYKPELTLKGFSPNWAPIQHTAAFSRPISQLRAKGQEGK